MSTTHYRRPVWTGSAWVSDERSHTPIIGEKDVERHIRALEAQLLEERKERERAELALRELQNGLLREEESLAEEQLATAKRLLREIGLVDFGLGDHECQRCGALIPRDTHASDCELDKLLREGG